MYTSFPSHKEEFRSNLIDKFSRSHLIVSVVQDAGRDFIKFGCRDGDGDAMAAEIYLNWR